MVDVPKNTADKIKSKNLMIVNYDEFFNMLPLMDDSWMSHIKKE